MMSPDVDEVERRVKVGCALEFYEPNQQYLIPQFRNLRSILNLIGEIGVVLHFE